MSKTTSKDRIEVKREAARLHCRANAEDYPATIDKEQTSKLKMAAGNEKQFTEVIIEDEVHKWVGVGWIFIREATSDDYVTIREAV